jgi:hypothetical protein
MRLPITLGNFAMLYGLAACSVATEFPDGVWWEWIELHGFMHSKAQFT